MPIKTYRPTTPTRRFQTVVSREDITKDRPEKSLVESKKRSGGRSSTGRVSSRFIGGGHKQAYRIIDFKRDKAGVVATVAAIEYDPNRTSRIALLHYADGEKRYILQPDGPQSGAEIDVRTDCRYPDRQRASTQEHSTGNRWCTTSSCGRARARRWRGRRGRRCS
jgi:large subunit ribosomal protein L2